MTEVLTVKATDLDSGQNAKITYHLDGIDTAFDIETTSGLVYVKSQLDRELKSEYRLIVTATDHGIVCLQLILVRFYSLLDTFTHRVIKDANFIRKKKIKDLLTYSR